VAAVILLTNPQRTGLCFQAQDVRVAMRIAEMAKAELAAWTAGGS
jgi:hypothetical protein